MPKPKVWNGAAKLKPLLRQISELRTNPNNPRQGDVGALMGLLQAHGQILPLVEHPDEPGLILAGNHRLMAMTEMGWTHAAVVPYDGDDPDGFALADNRASDLATYNDAALAEMLSERAVADMLIGTGFDGDDVDALIAATSLQGDIDQAMDGIEDEDKADGKDGEKSLVYNLVFEDREQQLAFYEAEKRLKRIWPDVPTAAGRVVAALNAYTEMRTDD